MYTKELEHYRFGAAVFRPTPYDVKSIMIGDVGIFDTEGHFVTLFSAVFPEDHPSQADHVPRNHLHYQLDRRNPIRSELHDTGPYIHSSSFEVEEWSSNGER